MTDNGHCDHCRQGCPGHPTTGEGVTLRYGASHEGSGEDWIVTDTEGCPFCTEIARAVEAERARIVGLLRQLGAAVGGVAGLPDMWLRGYLQAMRDAMEVTDTGGHQ